MARVLKIDNEAGCVEKEFRPNQEMLVSWVRIITEEMT